MTRLVLRGLATRKLRSALTAIAILLGVAMVSGTFVLSDQIQGAFDEIFLKANAGTDVVLTHATAFSAAEQQAGPIPASLLPTVERVPGVASAAGEVVATGSLVVDGRFIEAKGGPPIVLSNTPAPFNENQVVAGTLPTAPGEVAVDKGMADREGIHPGQRAQLATLSGLKPVVVSGVFRFAATSIGGATIVVTTLSDAQRWFNRVGQYSAISLAAERGVSAEELARRVRAVVPASVKVQTGDQNAREQASNAGGITKFLTVALLVFAFVAVLVGAFVIFNTFSITVAQRVRELAMLRTIGASRRQVLWAVMGEALVIGIVASVIGLFLGLAFAKLLNVIFNAVGIGLPTTGLVLHTRTVLWSLGVGIVVSFVAALAPALRATHVPPIAALREGSPLPRGRLAAVRPYLAGVIGLIGLVVLLSSLFGSGDVQSRALAMAAGAVLVFIAVAAAGRQLVPPIARAVGWPLERLFGGTARLARENAVRNPGRTGATAAALMIGIGLMAFATIFLEGLQTSFTDALSSTVRGDLIVQGRNFQSVPRDAVPRIAAVPGIGAVAPVDFVKVKVGAGGMDSMSGVDPASAARSFHFNWLKGSDALWARLGPGTALVEKNFADSHHLSPGDRFTATTLDAHRATFVVLGVYRDPQLFTGFTISDAVFRRLVPKAEPGVIVASLAPGADLSATTAAVTADLRDTYPVASVKTKAQYEATVRGQVNVIRNLLYGLLLMPVIISVFGIINTLVLSVFERTREIGMMRAIGLTRPQLRGMIRFESVITAIIGGVLGIGIGILFGWLMVKALESEGITFAVPPGQLVLFLVLAVVAGLAAAALPARRAARLNVLEALHYE